MKVNNTHFDIKEFVPKSVYDKYGDGAIKFIDLRLVHILERIREICGDKAITINNWSYGGKFQYRGYRPPECTVGALKSMHKLGRAVDFDVKGMSAEQVRQSIRDNQDELLSMGLTRMESGVSWVHIDNKETGLKYIYEFKP